MKTTNDKLNVTDFETITDFDFKVNGVTQLLIDDTNATFTGILVGDGSGLTNLPATGMTQQQIEGLI